MVVVFEGAAVALVEVVTAAEASVAAVLAAAATAAEALVKVDSTPVAIAAAPNSIERPHSARREVFSRITKISAAATGRLAKAISTAGIDRSIRRT